MGNLTPAQEAREWDFFVSYTSADLAWAAWVAWQLEDAGYRVLFQEWDFVPGSNWRFRMNEGVQCATRTVAILSEAYLESIYASNEWQATQNADPTGFIRKLIPIRIEDCRPPALLAAVVWIDLFDRTVEDAHRHLLEQLRGTLTVGPSPQPPPLSPHRLAAPHPSPSLPFRHQSHQHPLPKRPTTLHLERR